MLLEQLEELKQLEAKVRRYRFIALMSYFALFALLLINTIWWLPSTLFPTAIVLLLLVGPLLFPLMGILNGKAYTHAWTSYLALFYLLHGIWEWSGHLDNWLPGLLQTLFAGLLFYGAIFYARFAKQLARESGRDPASA